MLDMRLKRLEKAWITILFLGGIAGFAYGAFMESFEDVAIGQMPPAGWRKWEEAGGRGWSNSWAGR